MSTAIKTRPLLWKKIVKKTKDGEKGGKKGQWSARKAQLATSEYQSHFKSKAAAYKGSTPSKTNSLKVWQRQKWGTKSGKNSVQGKSATGERYLDRRSLKALTPGEYKRTTQAKRRAIKKGVQFSKQPSAIAAKTKRNRKKTK